MSMFTAATKLILLSLIVMVVIVVVINPFPEPTSDDIHQDHPLVATTLTFDTPMIYVSNCSQCSNSRRAQEIGVFLLPEKFTQINTGFIDKETTIDRTVPPNATFVVQEVFSHHPRGLEAINSGPMMYMIIKDSVGSTSVTLANIESLVEISKNY